MYKLDPDKQILITRENLEIILLTYGISIFDFIPIDQGIANTSILIQSDNKKHVLRIYAQDRNTDQDILLELNFQDFLREKGIPIPIIYKNIFGVELNLVEISGKKWQVILMDFINGNSVTPSPSIELITDLANIQAKMHLYGEEFSDQVKIPKEKWRNLSDNLASKITDIQIKKEEVLGFLERVKAYNYGLPESLPCGYNHLDIDFDGNVITENNKVNGIVDFEDLQYSPVIVCLGYTLWNILDDQGLEIMKKYLEEYEKIRSLTEEEKIVLPNVIFFRNYVIGVVRLLLWDEKTDLKDFEDILQLEKDIPVVFNMKKN